MEQFKLLPRERYLSGLAASKLLVVKDSVGSPGNRFLLEEIQEILFFQFLIISDSQSD